MVKIAFEEQQKDIYRNVALSFNRRIHEVMARNSIGDCCFKQNRKWPLFNVTDRALEETATEIVKVISSRLGLPDSVIF